MREIKFRAWDKKKKKMIQVRQLCLDNSIGWSDGESGLHIGLAETEYHVMQFTGLHDKNGKEIYEGDILKNDVVKTKPPEIGFVRYYRRTYELITNPKNYKVSAMGACGWEMSEIIGNVYESKELLKG